MPSDNALELLREERRQQRASDRRTLVVLIQIALAIAYVGWSIDAESGDISVYLGLLGLLGTGILLTRLLRRDARRTEVVLLTLGSTMVAAVVCVPIAWFLALQSLGSS